MNILRVSQNKFIVELSRNDLNELDITYERMDYSDIETRRVIWTVLERVSAKFGKHIDPSENLLIEAASDCEGGCVLCLTLPEKKRDSGKCSSLILKGKEKAVFEFTDENSLLDMLSCTERNLLPENIRIFRNGEKFRAVLDCLPAPSVRKTLEEFSRFVGSDAVTVSRTSESWSYSGTV